MTTSPVPSTHIDVRALFVHALDDEAITTGGTIAVLVAAGVDVRVVTCTPARRGRYWARSSRGWTRPGRSARRLPDRRVKRRPARPRCGPTPVPRGRRPVARLGHGRDTVRGPPQGVRRVRAGRGGGDGRDPRRVATGPRRDLRPSGRVRAPRPRQGPRGGARRARRGGPPPSAGGVDRDRAVGRLARAPRPAVPPAPRPPGRTAVGPRLAPDPPRSARSLFLRGQARGADRACDPARAGSGRGRRPRGSWR